MINGDMKWQDRMTAPHTFFLARCLASTRVMVILVMFLAMLVMSGFVCIGFALAAQAPEAEMGQALMEMDKSSQSPEAAPPAAGAAGFAWKSQVSQ